MSVVRPAAVPPALATQTVDQSFSVDFGVPPPAPGGAHPYRPVPVYGGAPLGAWMRVRGSLQNAGGGLRVAALIDVTVPGGADTYNAGDQSQPFDFAVPVGAGAQASLVVQAVAVVGGGAIACHLIATVEWFASDPLVRSSTTACGCRPCGRGAVGSETGFTSVLDCAVDGTSAYWTEEQYFGSLTRPSSSLLYRCGPIINGFFMDSDFDGSGNLLNPDQIYVGSWTDPSNQPPYVGMRRSEVLALGNVTVNLTYEMLYYDPSGLAEGVVAGILRQGRGAQVTWNPFGPVDGGGNFDIDSTQWLVRVDAPFADGLMHTAGARVLALPVHLVGASPAQGYYFAAVAYSKSQARFGDIAGTLRLRVTMTINSEPVLIPGVGNPLDHGYVGQLYRSIPSTRQVMPTRPRHRPTAVVAGVPHLLRQAPPP